MKIRSLITATQQREENSGHRVGLLFCQLLVGPWSSVSEGVGTFFVLLFLFSSPNFILTALIELKNLILRKSRSVAKIVLASC